MGCGCGHTTTNSGYHLITDDGNILTDTTGTEILFATRIEAEVARARHGGTIIAVSTPR